MTPPTSHLEDRLRAYGSVLDAAPLRNGANVASPRRNHRNALVVVTWLAVVLSVAALIRGQRATSRATVTVDVAAAQSQSMVFPVDGQFSFVDTWGAPRMVGTKYERRHQGTDVFAPAGAAIRAMRGGRVSRIGRAAPGGNELAISDPDGNEYSYALLGRFAKGMRKGDVVATGQAIGFLGSEEPEVVPSLLHFELRIPTESSNGPVVVNPFPLLDALRLGRVIDAVPVPKSVRVTFEYVGTGAAVATIERNLIEPVVTPADLVRSYGNIAPLKAMMSAPPVAFHATLSIWTNSLLALRSKHCGSSIYDVYLLPAEQCSLPIPPALIPTKQLLGFRIEFIEAGKPISTTSAVYRWLTEPVGASTRARTNGLTNEDRSKPGEWYWVGEAG